MALPTHLTLPTLQQQWAVNNPQTVVQSVFQDKITGKISPTIKKQGGLDKPLPIVGIDTAKLASNAAGTVKQAAAAAVNGAAAAGGWVVYGFIGILAVAILLLLKSILGIFR